MLRIAPNLKLHKEKQSPKRCHAFRSLSLTLSVCLLFTVRPPARGSENRHQAARFGFAVFLCCVFACDRSCPTSPTNTDLLINWQNLWGFATWHYHITAGDNAAAGQLVAASVKAVLG